MTVASKAPLESLCSGPAEGALLPDGLTISQQVHWLKFLMIVQSQKKDKMCSEFFF